MQPDPLTLLSNHKKSPLPSPRDAPPEYRAIHHNTIQQSHTTQRPFKYNFAPGFTENHPTGTVNFRKIFLL
jgi:hypothetical protein